MAIKNSTTRETTHMLKAGLNEIVFSDTKPNHVYMNNLSVSDLFLGVTVIPTQSVYDKYIPANGEALFARELGVTRIQIFVQGTGQSMVKITSFEADFEPMTLAGATEVYASGSGGGGDFDGIIRGFNAPLPSGSNNIGKVVVSEMPPITVETGVLPEGTNNIGKVDIANMPSLPAGANNIGKVGVVGGLTIESMPPVSLNGNVQLSDTSFSIKSVASYYSYNSSVSSTEVNVALGFEVNNFKFISNDDDANDLIITFGATPTTAAAGANGAIILKPNEVLNDLNVKCTQINFKRVSGSGKVRFMGV